MTGDIRTMITFTPERLKTLKRVYDKAVKEGKDEFEFMGYPLLTGYAKYLIEYLEDRFKQINNGQEN